MRNKKSGGQKRIGLDTFSALRSGRFVFPGPGSRLWKTGSPVYWWFLIIIHAFRFTSVLLLIRIYLGPRGAAEIEEMESRVW